MQHATISQAAVNAIAAEYDQTPAKVSIQYSGSTIHYKPYAKGRPREVSSFVVKYKITTDKNIMIVSFKKRTDLKELSKYEHSKYLIYNPEHHMTLWWIEPSDDGQVGSTFCEDMESIVDVPIVDWNPKGIYRAGSNFIYVTFKPAYKDSRGWPLCATERMAFKTVYEKRHWVEKSYGEKYDFVIWTYLRLFNGSGFQHPHLPHPHLILRDRGPRKRVWNLP